MKIQNRDELHLVGYRITAPMDELSTSIAEANERMRADIDEVDGRTGEHLLSATMGLEDGNYTHFVGVEVERDTAPPQDMETLDLPSARWVHFTHHGPNESIGDSIFTMRRWADQHEHPTEHVFIALYPLEGDGPIDLLVRLDEPTIEQSSEDAETSESRPN